MCGDKFEEWYHPFYDKSTWDIHCTIFRRYNDKKETLLPRKVASIDLAYYSQMYKNKKLRLRNIPYTMELQYISEVMHFPFEK